MSNSARVADRHSLLSVVAVTAIIALLAAGMAFLAPNGATARGADVGDSSSSATASPTATPTSESTKSAFPKAQGWKRQPNGVKYHIIQKKGVVLFWTAKRRGKGSITWFRKGLRGPGAEVRWYDEGPQRVKYKTCGKKVRVDIGGNAQAEYRTLPAWKCKFDKD